MYLNNYGVDAVLQLSRHFLQKVIIREAYTRPGENRSPNPASLPNLPSSVSIPLPNGSLAIGLNIELNGYSEPGINVDTFRQQYTDSLYGQDQLGLPGYLA